MYVPLRVHGHHSMLTGVDSPEVLLQRAEDLDLVAMALCDVDSTAGWVDFVKAARDGGVRGILGAEISDPFEGEEGCEGRLVALVENEQGFRNLNKLVSARQLGFDPGHGGEEGEPEDFDLVRAAVEFQEGLIFLVDHPRLCIGLMGRVPVENVFVAISPASLREGGSSWRGSSQRARHGEVRNTHLTTDNRKQSAQEQSASKQATRRNSARDEEEPNPPQASEALDPPKTPPPARSIAATELLDAARATGFAILAVPDVYYAGPSGAGDHRVRVAIKHNALLDDLPAEWLAPRGSHLLGGREVCALYAELDDYAGPCKTQAPPGVPAMVARTLEVAARCQYLPPLGGVHFPEVELGEGESAYSKLCELAFEGAQERYRPLRPEVVRRLDYELATIDRLGFAAYFILVRQIGEYARTEGIPCVGRGSAADSLVAYCLKLTDADPFKYDLIFERFLNPTRSDRPDIDLDFCWRRRDEVTEHVYELFGSHRTAMISTLNCFGLRAAFRETALAHGFPPAVVSRWSKVLPYYAPSSAGEAFDGDVASPEEEAERSGRGTLPGSEHSSTSSSTPSAQGFSASEYSAPSSFTPSAQGIQHFAAVEERGLSSNAGPRPEVHRRRSAGHQKQSEDPRVENVIALAFRSTPEARDFPHRDERWQRVLRHAESLVGTPRHFGLHPGGVVVAPGPITDYAACQRAAKGMVVTQFDKNGVEAIGLVKMDLLGNRALTVLDDTLRELRSQGIEVDLEALPEDDAATGDTLAEGRSLACFQVESPGMRNLLQQTGARDMNAVIQAVALIRPGPAGSGMKDAYVRRFRKLEDPTPPHPRLTDVLWDTYGVMLYQEDVMRVAQALAGMDLAEADLLRRALQKRRVEELEPLAARFRQGCQAEGIAPEDAKNVWDLVANFASFGFCKAHAVTYGRIAYRAVWLKTHHPAVYMAAFINSHTGYYKQRVYVEEARRLGAVILPPDINRSAVDFSVEWLGGKSEERTPALRIGLGGVKGLSKALLERILEEREREGPYLSMPDFLERSRAHTDEAEHLIQCGALDAFDRTRPELLWRLHLLRNQQQRVPRELQRGGADSLDISQLDACKNTPGKRIQEDVEAARANTVGWRGGIGLGRAKLPAGESASLFPTPPTPNLVLPGLPNLSARERGSLEFELMGLTVHAHPTEIFPTPSDERIRRAFPQLREEERNGRVSAPIARGGPVNPCRCADLRDFQGGRITLRGWLVASRRVATSDGKWMRFLTLEDPSGLAEAVLFPDIYQRDGHRLTEFGVLCVTGIVQNQMGSCTLETQRIW